MKALVWRGGRELELKDLEPPSAQTGEVVVDITLAGVCGSDLHPYRGHPGPRRPPLVLGHEAVGTVPGRDGRFALFPLVSCGDCPACARSEPNLCVRRELLGLNRPGVFAQSVALPDTALVPVPESISDELAVLVEPLATCVGALRGEDIGPHSTVVVIGCGPIGLLTLHFLARRRARAVAVDPVSQRRDLARRLGAVETFAGVEQLAAATADLVVDAVGCEATWCGGIAAVRPGGRVVVVGLASAAGAMPVGDLVRRGIALRGHYAYTRSDFESALAELAERPPPVDWVTTLPLDDGAEGFRRLVNEPGTTTKVFLRVADASLEP
jgi:threonine dehydrogenase-like Zn-dependent dehydrogenase